MAVEDSFRFDVGFPLDMAIVHFNPVPSSTLYLFSCLLILPFRIGHHLCLGFQTYFCFEDFLLRILCAVYLYRVCHVSVFLPRRRNLLGEVIDINMKWLLFKFYVSFSVQCFQNILNSYSFLKSRNDGWNSRSSVMFTACWVLCGI